MLGQKYKNIFVGFLVQIKSLEFAFEINWPLRLWEMRLTLLVLRGQWENNVHLFSQVFFHRSNFHVTITIAVQYCLYRYKTWHDIWIFSNLQFLTVHSSQFWAATTVHAVKLQFGFYQKSINLTCYTYGYLKLKC